MTVRARIAAAAGRAVALALGSARGRIAAAAGLAVVLALGSAGAADAARCPAAVSAPSAIVVEVSTGTVVCSRAADRELPVGSTTKLMTALLTLERARLSDTFTAVRYRAAPAESLIGLRPGERMKVSDLLRGLLAYSGNDAAATLAEGVSGSRRAFVRAMNARARKLGLKETHYANPIGLDEAGNYSSARDLVTLATVLRTNSFFKRVVNSPQVTLRSGDHPRTFFNRNTLVRRVPYVNGVKTGHTRSAGYVLVGSARRHGIQLISAVLDTPSDGARDADTLRLFDFAFPRFQRVRSVIAGRVLARAPIRYRQGAELGLVATRTVRRVVPRGRRDIVHLRVTAPREVAGPIRYGQRLGKVVVRQNGRVVATVPLAAEVTVPAAGLAQRTKSAFATPLVLVAVAAAVLACSLLVARRRRSSNGNRTGRRQARAA
jgi:D-alanyl-D-alanine carboxypeptidase (penicillin-binding protein 5/6)